MSRSRSEIKKGQRSGSDRARGRVTLTRDDVVRAGVRLLDAEGLEGISMRKLAAALGTGPATLYWHVRDKDELLALVLDDAARRIKVPNAGTWDARLVELLSEVRRVLLPRPILVQVLWRAGWDIGPQTLRVAEAMIGLVAESGLPEDEVADAYFALLTLLLGFVLAETSGAGNPAFGTPAATDDDEAEGRAALIERYPNLVRYGPSTSSEGAQRRFHYGANGIIEGIKARSGRR